MHDMVDFLSPAVDRNTNAGVRGCYIMRHNVIYARNMALSAGVPYDHGIELNIPADPLDRALKRMKDVAPLEIDGDWITVKSGRLRSKIKCTTSAAPDPPDMPETWKPCPKNLVPALSLAVPFVGDRIWTAGIRLMDGRVTAIHNTMGIDVEVPGLVSPPILLTADVAKFLIEQGPPEEYDTDDHRAIFRYKDGRWVNANLIRGEFPPTVDKLFMEFPAKEAVEIDLEWRNAYRDAVALGDGKLWINRDGFRVKRDNADSFIDCPMRKLPKDHESYWDSKVLGPAVECATLWSPLNYPDRCPFRGDGFRGLVVGMKQ